jgi:flagellar protein FliS
MRVSEQRRRYQTNGTQSVSPERLVILLYERTRRDLAEARSAIDAGATETRHNALLHAQEIVEELAYAVRPDVWEGGTSILALYDYLLGLLVRANVEASSAAIAEADTIVGDLLGAWETAYTSLMPAGAPT